MFTETQRATLRALVDRIVPPDDTPGGWEAGVGEYLARQFGGSLKNAVEEYRLGLQALNAEAQASAGIDFADLTPAAQDALLANVESGAVKTAWPLEPQQFFRDAVVHTMEGFYGDPGNGGNRGEASWRMIGFEVRG